MTNPLPNSISVKLSGTEETIQFEQGIAEIRLGDDEWQRIGDAINDSDIKCLSAIEKQSSWAEKTEQTIQITDCILLHTAYIKKLGRLACALGTIAVTLGALALWNTLRG